MNESATVNLFGLALERPWMLWLLLPWLLFAAYFCHRQWIAHRALLAKIAPRFLRSFTAHNQSSLARHLFFLMTLGTILLLAGAGPTIPGDQEITAEGGRVLFLIDSSASMNAQDVGSVIEGAQGDKRFDLAVQIASELTQRLEGYRFGVVGYSGVSTIALPLTEDRALVAETLRVLEVHSFYQNTGSSFSAALDTALQFAADPSVALQVILLSDGEIPRNAQGETPGGQNYRASLEALAQRDVPIHSVALGSLEGQARVIYDFRDVIAKKEEKRALAEFTTRRVDEHLRRISGATDGLFQVAGGNTVERLAEAVLESPRQAGHLAEETSRRDISRFPLILFLLGFLIDALWIGRRRPPQPPTFDLDRLGDQAPSPLSSTTAWLSIPLLFVGLLGCESLLERAHLENERGIAKNGARQHKDANLHYERSRAYGIRSQIPTYNLARSKTLTEDHAAAHQLYQEAIELDPQFAEALYNDGVTLFLWGEEERDPQGCRLERTIDLWENARGRFEAARDLVSGTPLAQDAQVNLIYLRQKIEEYRALVENPPPECADPPPPPPQEGQPPPPPPQEDQPPPPQGDSGPSPPPGNSAPPPPQGGGGMDGNLEQQVGQALARIQEQRLEQGKYHRKSRPEQFPQEAWQNPEKIIWW